MDKTALTKQQALDVVREFKRVIASRYHSDPKVMMYGSYAKGYANPDSDIDVAVIVPKIEAGKWFDWAVSLNRDIEHVSSYRISYNPTLCFRC